MITLAQLEAEAMASPRNHWLRLEAVLLCLRQGQPAEALRRLEAVAHSPQIGPGVIASYQALIATYLASPGQTPLYQLRSAPDYHRLRSGNRFKPALPELRPQHAVPQGFPFDMAMPAMGGVGNEANFLTEAANQTVLGPAPPQGRLHIVAQIETAAELTALARALAKQSLCPDQAQLTVFIATDLPQGPMPLPTRWQKGKPWHLPRSEQINLFTDNADVVLFLGPGTQLDSTLAERALRYFNLSDALLMPLVALGDIRTPDTPPLTVFADRLVQKAWQGHRFPFRAVKSLNFAVSAARFRQLAGFEPRFAAEQVCASEFAFRFFESGGYIRPLAVAGDVAQPQTAGDVDHALYRQLCPNIWDRKEDGRFEIPKISIYIPAYKAARYITQAVQSVLSQDVEDLEVCIADDGSPDSTLSMLQTRFGDDPRVRWVSRRNGGIGAASNAAVQCARGTYIGQLDSDDCLKPGAIRRLASYLDDHPQIGCVYSSCERIDATGAYLKDEYSYPTFSHEKMLLTSIAHHFRMFRRQVWRRSEGFRTDIVNAVDYDMYLKMAELAPFHHIEEVLYQRRWHGANTSHVHEVHQTSNTHIVQRAALERMGLSRYWDVHLPDPDQPRRVSYKRLGKRVFFWPDYSRHNPYQRLLYATARADVDFIGAEIDTALQAIKADPGASGQTVFHLHWLNKLLEPAPSAEAATELAEAFLAKLRRFKDLGGRLVWTIHNTVSHDMPWAAVEIALARQIIALADKVHLQSAASLPEVEAVYSVPAQKRVVLPHGAYCGYYPDFMTRDCAREALGLAPGDDVILFLGQIRPYKGVRALVEAFRRLLHDRPQALLLLGGQVKDDLLASLSAALTPAEQARLHIVGRFIDDAELQVFFRAADFAVFPYSSVLTSGSLLLSLGFGVPAVVPAVGMTREVMEGHDIGLLYDAAGEVPALETALRAMCARKDEGLLPAMGQASRALAESLTWGDFRDALNWDHPPVQS
jgi:glycosyltransferase involved in cell wall biosynthesis